jgi:hypothetical protein
LVAHKQGLALLFGCVTVCAAQGVSFSVPRVYFNGAPIAVADFNGDGKPDLAVTGQPYARTPAYVSVLLGNGDGSFRTTGNNALGQGQVKALAAADFNGDGRMDLAVANGVNVAILLGNGDGTFQPAVEYPIGGGASFVAVGDFNGDGKPDLAVANGENNAVAILLNNGFGAFGPPTSFAVGPSPGAIAVGDFNGDGRPDLAVANIGHPEDQIHGSVSVLLGAGGGEFQPAVTYGSGSYRSIVAADFNGDGTLDLAAADSSSHAAAVMLGNGDGTFQAATNYQADEGVAWLAVGDFNGDGALDLAANTGWLLTGNGHGAFQHTGNYVEPDDYSMVVAADFNGDGKLDLAPAGESSILITLGSSHGTFQQAVTNTVPNAPWAVATGDFNGDGKLDLAVANTLTVSVLLGNGDGSFGKPVDFAAGANPAAVIVGDFNGDGKLDLAVGSPGGIGVPATVSILLGNGDGTFQAAQTFPVGAGDVAFVAADFNRDGKLDLAVSHGTALSIFLGNGDGSFQPAMNYAVWGAIALGDFNRDGAIDLALTSDEEVSILLGVGDGTFRRPVNYPAGGVTYSLAVGDINGDGNQDIVVAASTTPLSVLLGNGFQSITRHNRLVKFICLWPCFAPRDRRPCSECARAPRVGDIEFYGLHKLSEQKLLHTLHLKPGDPLPPSKGDLEDALEAISGVVLAHVEAACCEDGKTTLFIGIEEKGAPHLAFHSRAVGRCRSARRCG